jgi:hypothetical protein
MSGLPPKMSEVQVLTVPIPTIGCAQEEVLQDNHNPIPEHNLSSENRLVKRRNLAWGLTIVIWQTEVDN